MRLVATLSLLTLGTAALGAQAPDAEQVKKGRQVFDQMKCSLCHQVGDKGGKLGPSLDGVALRRDAATMRRILEHPDKELTDPGYKVKMPTFPFKDGDIDALIAFLQTLRAPSKGQAGATWTAPLAAPPAGFSPELAGILGNYPTQLVRFPGYPSNLRRNRRESGSAATGFDGIGFASGYRRELSVRRP